MDEAILRAQLQQPYRRDSWRTILRQLFLEVEFFAQPLEVPLTTERERRAASSRHQIGVATVLDQDGGSKKVAIYEIGVSSIVDLTRNRVGLRELIARSIDQVSANAVLAFFFQAGTDEYRLTYAARESELDLDTFEIRTRETAPKRFTFLLGPDEPCRTAAQRLCELVNKRESLDFRDIERAFSVERLNKEFFDKYKKHYEKFVDHLISSDAPEKIFGVTVSRTEKKEFDRACKPLRDFAKKLLGRIVFLHFLQRKGWLGCPTNSREWKNGDRDFMLSYFKLAEQKGEAPKFHSCWLTPLFFDALNNSERKNDIFTPTNTRIPYLNGGLFEQSAVETATIDFPENFFRELLDFFSQYNFTIDENDPEENEVGIDPEMLGHIFENLLEDNKDKGAYYTPKPIVQYMCQQALLQHLRANVGEHPELDRLVLEKDPGDRSPRSWVREHAKQIEQLIDNVKICDPAVGSGAFPIGMLNEMLQIKLALDLTLDPHESKKALVENCLHGVDIDPGAIEIARLRFWLSLVVDAKTPEPLPNLDYKLYCADSLVECVRGEAVNVGTKTPDNPQLRTEIEKLIQAKHKLYVAHSKPDKRQARHDLYLALGSLAEIELVSLRNNTNFSDAEFGRIVGELEELQRLLRDVRTIQETLAKKKGGTSVSDLDNALDLLERWFEDPKKSTFLWQLHFAEVFAAGGFHIVIENPPYLKERDNKKNFTAVVNSPWGSQYRAGKMDYWYFFLHRSLEIAAQNGSVAFITSRYWLNSSGSKKIIAHIRRAASLVHVVDFGNLPVFEPVSGHHMLHFYFVGVAGANCVVNTVRDSVKHVTAREPNAFVTSRVRSQQELFTPSGEIQLYPAKVSVTTERILGDVCDISQGVVEAPDKISKKIAAELDSEDIKPGMGVFVLSEAEMAALDPSDEERTILKPYLDPNDIVRYAVQPRTRKFLIYADATNKKRIASDADFQNLKTHLDKMCDAITSSNRPYGLHRPRKTRFFESPKIIAKNMFVTPEFTLDSSRYYFGMSFSAIIAKTPDIDLRIVLAVLNSRFGGQWFLDHGKKRGAGVDVGVDRLRRFPFPNVGDREAVRIAELVDHVTTAKNAGDEVGAFPAEAEIDQIVYRLFELTPEEIALIENSVPVKSGSVETR